MFGMNEEQMSLSDALKSAKEIAYKSEMLLKKLGMDFNEEIQNISQKNLTPDEKFEYNQLEQALKFLSDFQYKIDYLSKKIVFEGKLWKNSRDRYECEYMEFTSGNRIEYFAYDEYEECNVWQLSRVEHNGDDYYIVGDKELSLQGLSVRIRK